MTKKDYIALALCCREIEAGLLAMCNPPNDDMPVSDIMDLIVARLAWHCTNDNVFFDGFKFNAAARGRKA